MLKIAKVTASDRIYDIAYGDGRLVTTVAARYGARALVLPVCALGVSEARKGTPVLGFPTELAFSTRISTPPT